MRLQEIFDNKLIIMGEMEGVSATGTRGFDQFWGITEMCGGNSDL